MHTTDILNAILVLAALLSGLALTFLLLRHIAIETGRFDRLERELAETPPGKSFEG